MAGDGAGARALIARARGDFQTDAVLASRPKRRALLITLLRLTPPNRSAIVLAERPSCHNWRNSRSRSSVQFWLMG